MIDPATSSSPSIPSAKTRYIRAVLLLLVCVGIFQVKLSATFVVITDDVITLGEAQSTQSSIRQLSPMATEQPSIPSTQQELLVSVSSLAVQLDATPTNDDAPPPPQQEQPLPQPMSSNATSSVLTYPFRIVQVGAPRTGSTFQYNLLDAIVSLKTPPNVTVKYRGFNSGWDEGSFRARINHNNSFVFKYHKYLQFFGKLQEEGGIAVFSSGGRGEGTARYIQDLDALNNCSLCEVDNMKPIFGLTDDDVRTLKYHLGNYSIIRRCCGYQMSKYEIRRLNGCNMSNSTTLTEYPHCEDYDLDHVEKLFHASPIGYHAHSARMNWKRPGDCKRIRRDISTGKGFNKQKFAGCAFTNTKY